MNPPAKAGDVRDSGLTPGSGKSPGEEHGKPQLYSCLENPMARGAWQAIVQGITRVGHNLATKPPPTLSPNLYVFFKIMTVVSYFR